MSSPWREPEREAEYVKYLEHERHMYAWCLTRYGDLPQQTAVERANSFYQYEPAANVHRGLVFHDEAWHWAMLAIYGELYWKAHPGLASPSADYRHESESYDRTSQQAGGGGADGTA